VLIRCLLVPAMVALFGRANWWLPAPLARLLRVTPLARPACPSRPACPAVARAAAADSDAVVGSADVLSAIR